MLDDANFSRVASFSRVCFVWSSCVVVSVDFGCGGLSTPIFFSWPDGPDFLRGAFLGGVLKMTTLAEKRRLEFGFGWGLVLRSIFKWHPEVSEGGGADI